MQRLLILLAICLTVTSCSLFRVQKMNIEQGNVMNQRMIDQLHPGMPAQEVKNIMGSPMLINTFANNRVDYIYTYQPGYGQPAQKHVTLIFQHNVLVSKMQD